MSDHCCVDSLYIIMSIFSCLLCYWGVVLHIASGAYGHFIWNDWEGRYLLYYDAMHR